MSTRPAVSITAISSCGPVVRLRGVGCTGPSAGSIHVRQDFTEIVAVSSLRLQPAEKNAASARHRIVRSSARSLTRAPCAGASLGRWINVRVLPLSVCKSVSACEPEKREPVTTCAPPSSASTSSRSGRTQRAAGHVSPSHVHASSGVSQFAGPRKLASSSDSGCS